ncbi:MAG: response regulator [Variovorax sp.]|nr:MAG: response regulator [Variovorax sp.]
MAEAQSREARVTRRIVERRVALMTQYSRRLPAVYVGYIIIAVVAASRGLAPWAWIWLACTGAVMVYRFTLGRRVEKKSVEERIAALPKLEFGFTLNGFTTAPIVPLAFTAADNVTPLLVGIMLVAGCAVGAASVAGSQRAFMGFCSLTFLFMTAGWFWRGGTLGIALGIGIVTMYLVLLASVRDHGRNLKELMGLVEDNAQLSESVKLARDRAEAASEAKTRFFAAASHDLRQPLHALSINATTLDILAQRGNDGLLKEVSRGIGSALQQSSGLLDGLLDISRLDAHSIQARFAPHEVGALLRAVRDEYAALAAQQGLSLALELPPEPLWARTDSDQLMRILGNLVNNAIKFTQRGSVTLSARHGPDGHVLVQVADTGAGIAADQRERVFEEFYQVGNPSRDRSQGLGLGLAIVRRTAALLHIGLHLDSAPGRGTTFELEIDAAPAPAHHADGSATPAARAADGHRLAVLLVDDEAEVLSALCTYLDQLGWSVKGVATGDQAEQALAAGFVPDVMAVDYRLRNETGIEVIDRVRLRHPDLPAVIVTGETAPSRFGELSAAAERVLHKPLAGEVLARTLQEVVLGLDTAPVAVASAA